LNRQILRLAIPSILSTLSVPLLGMVDTALMGRMGNDSQLMAIGLGGIIFSLIYMVFGFLKMSTTGFVAQAKGREDEEEQVNILGRSIFLALLFSALVLLLKDPLAHLAFEVLGMIRPEGGAEALVYSREYYDVRIWAAPATMMIWVLTAWFLGMQDARIPMIITVVSNVANMFLSIYFVNQGMGVFGVALGTLLAQYLGLIIGLYFIFCKHRVLLKKMSRQGVYCWRELKKFLSVSGDILIRTFILIFVINFFMAASFRQGLEAGNANLILMQFWMLVSYAIDGFAHAAEGLVGRFIGAHDKTRLKQAIRYIFVWGLSLAALFSLCFYLAEDLLVTLFVSADKLSLITSIREYYPWVIAAPLLNAACFIWDGVYSGATAGRAMRNSMLFSALIVFFPLYFACLFKTNMDNHGLWLALTAFMIARGITLSFSAKRHIFRQK
jgi:MATE family multidrug resistance protein